MLEGRECNLSCETTSRAQILKQGVNTLQNLQAPCCKSVVEFLAHGFLLVAEWGWSLPAAIRESVFPVIRGYSKPKESAAPTYHTSCYFILQIRVWISCWINKQKESPVNSVDLGVCYTLDYYMQLTYVWCRTVSDQVLVTNNNFCTEYCTVTFWVYVSDLELPEVASFLSQLPRVGTCRKIQKLSTSMSPSQKTT